MEKTLLHPGGPFGCWATRRSTDLQRLRYSDCKDIVKDLRCPLKGQGQAKIGSLILTAILVFAFILVKKDRVDVPVILVHIFRPCICLKCPLPSLTSRLVMWPLWLVQHGKALRIYLLWIGAWCIVE